MFSGKPSSGAKFPPGGKTLFFALVLFLAIDALYGRFFWNPLVFDDFNFFDGKNLEHFSHFHFDFRWFPYASLAWTQKIFGGLLVWFRMGNLLLHFSVSLCLFFFLRRLFGVVLKEPTGLSNDWLAYFSALIFALHPVSVYAAGYLIQRSILMATGFGFLMLLTYMEGVVREKRIWFLSSVLFYFLAVFSKEHAVMLPAVAFALTFLLEKPSLQWLKKLWLPFLPFAIIGIIVVMKAKGVLGSTYEIYGASMIGSEKVGASNAHPLSVLTQGWLFFKYLFLWIFPDPSAMSVDMREPFASGFSLSHAAGLIAFMIYPVVAIILLLRRGRIGLAGFGLLFPWMLFMTELSTVRIQESFVLYRSYLWAGGLFCTTPLLFSRMPSKAAFLVLLVLSLILFPLARNRLITFSSDYRLWSDAAKLIEGRAGLVGLDRIYYNRGSAELETGRYPDAEKDFTKVIAISPNVYQAWYNRGYAYYHQNRFSDAVADFGRALAVNPSHAQAYFMRGLAYSRMKNEVYAHSDFRKSCDLGYERGCVKAMEP